MKEYTEGNKLVMEIELNDLKAILEDMNTYDKAYDKRTLMPPKTDSEVRRKVYRYLVISKIQEMEAEEKNKH